MVGSRTVWQFGGDGLAELGRWSGANLVLGNDTEQVLVAFDQFADDDFGRCAVNGSCLDPVSTSRHVPLLHDVLRYVHASSGLWRLPAQTDRLLGDLGQLQVLRF